MTLPIVFAPEAKIDLEEAADYYEMQQSGLGEFYLRAVDAGLARIQRFPKGFQLDDRIEIIAVWHERRDPEGWTERVEDDL